MQLGKHANYIRVGKKMDHIEYNIWQWVYPMIIFGILLFVYANNLRWLWSTWMENPNYSYAPLVPLISLFIILRKRAILKKIEVKGSNMGLCICLLAIILYILSLRTQVNFLLSYSMILNLIAIILFIYGKAIFCKIAFPIIFLVFMVPFWGGGIYRLGNMLKLLSTKLSFSILNLFGYPVFREGLTLYFANGTLEVVEKCSGIKTFLSLIPICILIAYFSKGKVKKIVFIMSIFPLALATNTLRIVFFGFMIAAKGMIITEVFLHSLIGLCTIFLPFFVLIAMVKWIKL